jgi:pimeloyl-ACP methyl ester carboxylesterase
MLPVVAALSSMVRVGVALAGLFMSSSLFSIGAAATLLCALAACAPMLPPLTQAPPAFHQVREDGKPVRLAVREAGRGKPILLIHGLGASSYTWRAITPQLAKTNRVIALDLKGFGESEKPLDDAYSIADQARLVEDYIARNNLRDVTLVGHSFGGAVAMAVALDDGQGGRRRRIEKLVLIDSLAYKQPVPFFFRVLQTPIIGELGMNLIPADVQIARALAIAYYHDDRVKDETIATYAGPLQSEGGKHALLRTVESLSNENAEAFASRYPTLKTPALLIWCAHDRIVPMRFGKRLSEDLPNAKIDVIEECGHIPQEEQPEETLAAIQKFAR